MCPPTVEVTLAYLTNLASASDLFRLVSTGASTAGAKQGHPVVSHSDSLFSRLRKGLETESPTAGRFSEGSLRQELVFFLTPL